MILKGQWCDGKTSAEIAATIRHRPGGGLVVEREESGELLHQADPAEVQASPRLGSTPRYLAFSGGGKFATLDNDGVDALLRLWKKRAPMAKVNLWEGRLGYVLICLVILALFIGAAIKWGMPLTARLIAGMLPSSAFSLADKQALSIMDKALFKPSQLDEAIQARLSRHLQPVLDDHPALGLKVIFRQGGSLGPNAFALPAGTVIFTDEMVALAQDDDELVAVLAHEIGHVAHRHAMRTLIQDSMLAFGVMALTGDVAGTSEVFIGLPVFLTEMYYSREFEFEADGYALAYMRKKGIKTAHFANLMHRLEQKVSGGTAAQESKITSYLSTHPRMQERLRPFEGSR